MIVSSPSAASFRSGACSPRSNPHSHSHSYSHSHAHLHPHASSSSSSAAATTHFAASARTSQQHSPLFTSPPASTTSLSVAAPAAVTSSPRQHRRSASRSLLSHSIEELRTALKNHSVAATASREPVSGPSGEHMSRGCMSAGPDTLGGDSRQSLTNDSHEPTTTVSNTNATANANATNTRIETQPPESESESAALPIATTVSETRPDTSVTAVSPSDVKGKRQLAEVTEPDSSSATAGPVSETQLSQQDGSSDETLDRARSKRLRPPVPAVKLLPRRYELVHPNDMVILISSMIMELIQYNDTIPLQGGKLTRFHSRTPPRISVRDYLQRLTTHATLSPPILLSMVYYIDRLCALYPAFTVSSLTVHRFLITSATVASKGLSDSFWTNKTYARVGGITITELAMLELDFLWRVEWKIVPQPEVLVDYYLSLVERCEGYALEPEDAPSADLTSPASSDMEGVITSPPADSTTQT